MRSKKRCCSAACYAPCWRPAMPRQRQPGQQRYGVSHAAPAASQPAASTVSAAITASTLDQSDNAATRNSMDSDTSPATLNISSAGVQSIVTVPPAPGAFACFAWQLPVNDMQR